MQEQLISFEVAKLAKEKGFDIPVRYGVFGKKMKLTENHGWERNKKLELRNWNTPNANSYSVPTQSLLQRWLREVHSIHVEISFNQKYENTRFGYIVRTQSTCFHTRDFPYKTYEEALEIGLQEGLKLIKNE